MSNDFFTVDNLNINSYNVVIPKLPDFNFKVKNVDLPACNVTGVEVPTPMQKMMVGGDTVHYDELTFTFIVDENLYNYCSIYNWLVGLGFPSSFEEFKELLASGVNVYNPNRRSYTIGETSDINLQILTNHKNPNIEVKYLNAFPVSLSGFSLGNSNTDNETITATASFRFTGMVFIVKPKEGT